MGIISRQLKLPFFCFLFKPHHDACYQRFALIFFILLLTITHHSHAEKNIALGERHLSTYNDHLFSFTGQHFEDYIQYERAFIDERRTDLATLSNEMRQAIVKANAPFILKPANTCQTNAQEKHSKGVLLSHGLSDSPYTMLALAQYFQSKCFLVYGLLLPGHGSRPGGLANADWLEWSKAMDYSLNLLQQQVEELYIGGFSTGATLAIHNAAGRDDIKGLFLFAPAISVTSFAQFAKLHHLISWIFPRRAWLDILPDENPYKYESFSLNAVTEIHYLTQAMQSKVKEKGLKTNIFIAASWEDTTVDTAAAIAFFKHLENDNIQLLLFSQFGQKTLNTVELPLLSRVINSGRNNGVLDMHGLSHIAIPIADNDQYYGPGNNFKECKIYFSDKYKHSQCQQGKAKIMGEITEKNQALGIVQRISYNPFFHEMLKEMDIFLKDR